jgi:hypothetical protein
MSVKAREVRVDERASPNDRMAVLRHYASGGTHATLKAGLAKLFEPPDADGFIALREEPKPIERVPRKPPIGAKPAPEYIQRVPRTKTVPESVKDSIVVLLTIEQYYTKLPSFRPKLAECVAKEHMATALELIEQAVTRYPGKAISLEFGLVNADIDHEMMLCRRNRAAKVCVVSVHDDPEAVLVRFVMAGDSFAYTKPYGHVIRPFEGISRNVKAAFISMVETHTGR